MIITGIEKLYYALVTADTAAALTFGTPVYLDGVKELGIRPAQNVAKLYGENKLWAQATSLDSVEVSIALANLTSAERVALLGQSTASEGGVYAKNTDSPPDVAILYKANVHGGGYRYGVLYKGQFSLPEDSVKGQEGSIEFQTPTMTGTFGPTINNGYWQYHVDSSDPNYAINTDADWFGAVIVPSADATAPTVTCVPADAGDLVKTGNVVFTFSKAMDVTTLTSANLIVMKADGSKIEGCEITYDSALKVVTLNPTETLAEVAYIAIATTGCKSATGVALAAHNVFNFTATA